MVMLTIYIGLQLFVFVLGVKVGRIYFWLFHLNPSGSVNLNCDNESLILSTNEYYDRVCWIPPVQKLLIKVFGNDS